MSLNNLQYFKSYALDKIVMDGRTGQLFAPPSGNIEIFQIIKKLWSA